MPADSPPQPVAYLALAYDIPSAAVREQIRAVLDGARFWPYVDDDQAAAERALEQAERMLDDAVQYARNIGLTEAELNEWFHESMCQSEAPDWQVE